MSVKTSVLVRDVIELLPRIYKVLGLNVSTEKPLIYPRAEVGE